MLKRWPTDEEIAAAELGHDMARQLASQILSRVLPVFSKIKKPPREVTRITAHGKDGRILEMEKVQRPAYDGRQNLNTVARNLWTGLSAVVFKDDDAAPYIAHIGRALGSGRSFVSRLKSLSEIEKAETFWQKADRWHGGHRTKAKVQASVNRSYDRIRAMAELARRGSDFNSSS